MELGVVFPANIGTDSGVIREFARTAERLGYQHFRIADHILGAPPDHPNLSAPHDHTVPFHEPLVLIGHLSAVTTTMRFITGVLVLPRRQAVLVAKQAAQADILSDGRLQLGVGVGANQFEYEAMGMDFANRGNRIEEQIKVMRALWQNQFVDFEGEFHSISNAGMNPRPLQQPIPIWMGGGKTKPVLRRIAKYADGWLIPARLSFSALEEKRDYIFEQMGRFGRNPDNLRLLGYVKPAPDAVDEWVDEIHQWRDFGATDMSIKTWDIGWKGSELIEGIREVKEIIDTNIDLE